MEADLGKEAVARDRLPGAGRPVHEPDLHLAGGSGGRVQVGHAIVDEAGLLVVQVDVGGVAVDGRVALPLSLLVPVVGATVDGAEEVLQLFHAMLPVDLLRLQLAVLILVVGFGQPVAEEVAVVAEELRLQPLQERLVAGGVGVVVEAAAHLDADVVEGPVCEDPSHGVAGKGAGHEQGDEGFGGAAVLVGFLHGLLPLLEVSDQPSSTCRLLEGGEGFVGVGVNEELVEGVGGASAGEDARLDGNVHGQDTEVPRFGPKLRAGDAEDTRGAAAVEVDDAAEHVGNMAEAVVLHGTGLCGERGAVSEDVLGVVANKGGARGGNLVVLGEVEEGKGPAGLGVQGGGAEQVLFPRGGVGRLVVGLGAAVAPHGCNGLLHLLLHGLHCVDGAVLHRGVACVRRVAQAPPNRLEGGHDLPLSEAGDLVHTVGVGDGELLVVSAFEHVLVQICCAGSGVVLAKAAGQVGSIGSFVKRVEG